MSASRWRRLAVPATIAVAMMASSAGAAAAVPQRASLMDVESAAMCVVCNEPLAVAESPQAYRERNFIRALIAKGETKPQILRALVAVYGPAVLAKPPAQGFNLTLYVLPPAALLAGLALLAYTLPRWRRRVRARAALASPAGTSLTPAEQQRLDEELSRFAG